mmetsp:Transcript_31782/g.71268  ORF Transcript_31782/g.71268 Transcript_31782/m.71268 type:complete len:498 (+) Transcript_31782:61-1554(+)
MGGMNAMSAVAVAVALVSSALAAGAMVDVDGGLTLGDLDRMDGRAFPGADPFGTSVHGRTFAPLDGGDADPTDEPSGKRGLGRIHLDLSGRVMCHVLSPGSPGDREDRARHGGAPPLFSLQDGLQSGPQAKSKRARRLVPGVHLGADYDLDEVWYGATRWLARLSWGPFCVFRNNEKPGDENGILAVARRRLSASSLCNSPLAIDLEGERSVFDPRDRTTRLRIDRLIPHSSSAAKLSRMKGLASTDGRLTVEYDSAKYTEEDGGLGPVLFAPKITTDVRLPLLFNSRVEVRSRRSWIIQDGGDGDGNYYAGRHLGGISPAASLLEHVREGYRRSVPRGARREGGGPGDERLGIGGRVNRWLEEDGWAPKRVSTDLMGNLRSVSEVGLAGGASPSTRRPLRRIRGPFHASGLRLRVSRRIGWSSLGIFPWSKNSGGEAGPSLADALGGTGVGLELRGLNGECDGVTSFAIVVADAAEWRDSTRFVLARESVAIAGSR